MSSPPGSCGYGISLAPRLSGPNTSPPFRSQICNCTPLTCRCIRLQSQQRKPQETQSSLTLHSAETPWLGALNSNYKTRTQSLEHLFYAFLYRAQMQKSIRYLATPQTQLLSSTSLFTFLQAPLIVSFLDTLLARFSTSHSRPVNIVCVCPFAQTVPIVIGNFCMEATCFIAQRTIMNNPKMRHCRG